MTVPPDVTSYGLVSAKKGGRLRLSSIVMSTSALAEEGAFVIDNRMTGFGGGAAASMTERRDACMALPGRTRKFDGIKRLLTRTRLDLEKGEDSRTLRVRSSTRIPARYERQHFAGWREINNVTSACSQAVARCCERSGNPLLLREPPRGKTYASGDRVRHRRNPRGFG